MKNTIKKRQPEQPPGGSLKYFHTAVLLGETAYLSPATGETSPEDGFMVSIPGTVQKAILSDFETGHVQKYTDMYKNELIQKDIFIAGSIKNMAIHLHMSKKVFTFTQAEKLAGMYKESYIYDNTRKKLINI